MSPSLISTGLYKGTFESPEWQCHISVNQRKKETTVYPGKIYMSVCSVVMASGPTTFPPSQTDVQALLRGRKKKKKCSGEKREPTEGSLILLIVHSTSLIAWDCAAKERMQWQIQWLLAGEGCCARAVRFPLWCVVVLGFVLARTLSMPGSGGKEVSDFTKSYEAPVEIDPTIPKVRATHECMSSLSRAPISRVYNRT